ncbi:MAG: bifunctional riboflavin kinase/FAD synthetase [Pseudomonadota bacterium]
MAQLLGSASSDGGSVVTIGGYDGIHAGHQALIQATRAEATARGVPAVVMSFEPLPKEYFAGNQAPARLTRFRERFGLLAADGVDGFFCPRFDAGMAAISVDDFIHRYLVSALRVRHLVIGDDFRFGHRAAGNVDDLRRAGDQFGYSVAQVNSVEVQGQRVSSTSIRQALARGDMAYVEVALQRQYQLSGKVIRGRQLGRTLGYPTANIDLHRRTPPVSGIFAVQVDGIDATTHLGVASIGTRPTVGGEGVLLEVFVFDFTGDLYGKRLRVTLKARLRDEQHFDDLDALVKQMDRDAAAARELLT